MVKICCVRRDGAAVMGDLDFFGGATKIEELFGKELIFSGHPGKSQGGYRLEWVEVSGHDLDFLKDLLVGAMMPRYEGGRPKVDSFRWYGDLARTVLGAHCLAVMPDSFRPKAG